MNMYDALLSREFGADEHTANTLYVKEYERIVRHGEDDSDPFVSEFGRMPKRETFKHYME